MYLSCLSVSKQNNRDQDLCMLDAVGPVVGGDILVDVHYVTDTTEFRVASNRMHAHYGFSLVQLKVRICLLAY